MISYVCQVFLCISIFTQCSYICDSFGIDSQKPGTAAVISAKAKVNPMDEIFGKLVWAGSSRLMDIEQDVVFGHVGFAYNSGKMGMEAQI